MSQRPILKLKLSGAAQASAANAAAAAASTKTQTPATGTPKLKLKFGASAAVPPTPEKAPAPKMKQPRKPKKEPPPKITTSTPKSHKKREVAPPSEDEDPVPVQPTVAPEPAPAIKKIKFKANNKPPPTPFIRVKSKGKPPARPLGVGYDSEASDREEDPAIEEEFILRMQPGEDCDYLRKAVADRRFGPRSEGGADVKMKFLTRDGRRAVVTIKGRHYAASLVDLPCIIEAMKSWDKKQFFKSADICQMLLVLGRIDKEEDSMSYPLPDDVDKATWQYAHGITPPMCHVRKRRFRQRVSNKTIEAVEEEVERLLRADEECIGESTYEILDAEKLREEQARLADEEEGYVDEEGLYEEDEEYHDQSGVAQDGEANADADADADAEDENDVFAAALEEAWKNEANNPPDATTAAAAANVIEASPATDSPLPLNATPAANSEASTPAAGTPMATGTAAAAADDDDDDDSSSGEDAGEDEDENGSGAELDEAVLERQADLVRQREEIADLEAAIEGQMKELERQKNPILKNKVILRIKGLRADLELKKAAIGEGGEED